MNINMSKSFPCFSCIEETGQKNNFQLGKRQQCSYFSTQLVLMTWIPPIKEQLL